MADKPNTVNSVRPGVLDPAIASLAAENAGLRRERDALARFKAWVHDYLDAICTVDELEATIADAIRAALSDALSSLAERFRTLAASNDRTAEEEAWRPTHAMFCKGAASAYHTALAIVEAKIKENT